MQGKQDRGGSRPVNAAGHADSAEALARIEQHIQRLERRQATGTPTPSSEIREMRDRLAALTRSALANLNAWDTVRLARHADRPGTSHYIERCFTDFCELHGDRCFGDDPAITTGFGRIGGHRVLVIGHNKGRHTDEKVACNFGYAHPEGYRKALRTMKLAEKYALPVVSLIDTPGAHPGAEAERRGIAPSIATNLMEMSRLRVPIVCVVIGEGGSGGALGIGIGDRVAMLEHAYYSVITPEGCAGILFDDVGQAPRAADTLRITADDVKRLGLIDDIVAEPVGGAHTDVAGAAHHLETYLRKMLDRLSRASIGTLLARRHRRLRSAGGFVCTPHYAEET